MLKQKLDTLQQKTPVGGAKRDYSLTFWRPTVGKQQIRIVPSAFNSNNPFTELKFYYGITNKVMLSPETWGDKDPIALFASKLREEYSKENYLLAKKLDAKIDKQSELLSVLDMNKEMLNLKHYLSEKKTIKGFEE